MSHAMEFPKSDGGSGNHSAEGWEPWPKNAAHLPSGASKFDVRRSLNVDWVCGKLVGRKQINMGLNPQVWANTKEKLLVDRGSRPMGGWPSKIV